MHNSNALRCLQSKIISKSDNFLNIKFRRVERTYLNNDERQIRHI